MSSIFIYRLYDPYGMEDDDYERCFEQIARLVKKIWQERLGGNKMIGIGSDHGGYALKRAICSKQRS